MFSVLRPDHNQYEIFTYTQLVQIAEELSRENKQTIGSFYVTYLVRLGWKIVAC